MTNSRFSAGPGIVHRWSHLVRYRTHRRWAQYPQLDLDFRNQRDHDYRRGRRLPLDMPGTGRDGVVLDTARKSGWQGKGSGEHEQSGEQGVEMGWDGRSIVALARYARLDT